jgi:hypothetical protein
MMIGLQLLVFDEFLPAAAGAATIMIIDYEI